MEIIIKYINCNQIEYYKQNFSYISSYSKYIVNFYTTLLFIVW